VNTRSSLPLSCSTLKKAWVGVGAKFPGHNSRHRRWNGRGFAR
jgi:hypothetical protein